LVRIYRLKVHFFEKDKELKIDILGLLSYLLSVEQ